MRTAATALLATALLAGAVASPAQAQNYPRLGLHGRIYGTGFPLILGGTTDGPLNNAALDAYARYHEVTVGASPISEYRPDIAQALRLRRPDIQLMAYVIGHYIWDAPNAPDSTVDYTSRYRILVSSNNGYLYNKAGGKYSFANVNLAKKTNGRFVIAEGLADLFNSVIVQSGLWDGIFVDQYCNSILWSQSSRESIDVARAGYTSQSAFDAAWLAATDTLANRLRRLAGPDFVLIGNCGQGTKYASFNGWMRENFPYQNGGNWYQNMFGEPGGYMTDDKKFRQPTHDYIFTATNSPGAPYNSADLAKERLGLGSAALGDGYGIFAPSDLDAVQFPYYYWWYDEYAVDLTSGRADSSITHTGWLGQPLGPSYQMIWVGTNPDAVTNPDVETDLSGWTFNTNGQAATWSRDTTTGGSGRASIHVHQTGTPAAEYVVNLTASGGSLPVSVGLTYSATFWAKADHATRFTVVAGIPGSGSVASRPVDVGTTWQQYQIALTPAMSATVKLQFYLGYIDGDVWLDGMHLQAGSTTLFRRDFQNGTVLVNPASSSMSVPLGGPYRRILGYRDPVVNDGATITTITVPPNDARFLIGQDITPPAAVNDLRPSPN